MLDLPHRGMRIQDNTRFDSLLFDELDRPVKVRARFNMDGQKYRRPLLQKQVYSGQALQSLNERRAEVL